MNKRRLKARIKELEAEHAETQRHLVKMEQDRRHVMQRAEEQTRELQWKLDAARRVLSDGVEPSKW